MRARQIEVFDTTLRDGVQAEGVVFSLEDKIKLIRALDDLGVDYIEAGIPTSNPKDAELFRYAREHMRLKRARLVAFGMTHRPGINPEEDQGLNALLSCGAHVISMVGKASARQVTEVLGVTLEENIRMISQSVGYGVQNGAAVFFDAEHFFDGYRENPEYALSCLIAAKDAGASRLILCDTNGGSLPDEIAEALEVVEAETGIPIGIHCHNDSGLATACTLAAVKAGAVQIQGTINGYGERCGNANLCEVIPGICLKLGIKALPDEALKKITGVARYFAEIANLKLNERMPYVGNSAFAHKGGMHIDGVIKEHSSFEHVDPELVGNHRRYLISEVAGRSALLHKLRQLSPEISRDSELISRMTEEIKGLEAKGYSFEDADGSLTLRLLDALGRRPEFFRVLDFQVFSRRPEGPLNAQAYVKVSVNGMEEITADEGDGPVNALDLALRKALSKFYPVLGDMRLVDFKVRVVSTSGTASSVRVFIESTDGESTFATVGVSTNIIEASFIALTDSINCLLMNTLGRK